MFAGEGWPMWQVWLLYLFVGSVVLTMLYYPMRKLSKWANLFLLAPVAAMMFAPLTIEAGSSHWAPALLVMIFEFEKDGSEGLFRGLFPIVLVWLAILALGSAWMIKKKQRKQQLQIQNTEE
jgi:hypothetical protein